MAKKRKKTKHHAVRNAAPRAPRAPRATADHDETSLKRLGYTAAGAAGSAFLGAFLSKEGWAPKTVAGALTALGAGLTWKGEGATTKSVGSGAMSSAGGQLVLMMMDEHSTKQPTPQVATATAKKPSNADDVPAGSIERALERARARIAINAQEGAA
ncbi:MAG: hypothetical protein JO257_15425 [Deltaproteobacteria bacterium]|nr:hypothetical protein [Deltaproteobacteria bacterium]